jgi:hypothetical protein
MHPVAVKFERCLRCWSHVLYLSKLRRLSIGHRPFRVQRTNAESKACDIDSVEIVMLFPLQILASVLLSAMKLKILTEQKLVERNSETCCAGHPRFGGIREAIRPYGLRITLDKLRR